MGQAKLRKAEIMALKSQGSKKSNIDGFIPDAGINSAEGTNHYWFQVAEMLNTMLIQPKMRGYTLRGVNYIELNTEVDIMDIEGKQHTAPKNAKGYFATLRFTADSLDQLADQISKGAMSVRVSGIPAEADTSPTGEKFRIIDATDSWSAGNNSGHMTYIVNGHRFDSDSIAQKFKDIANQIRAK